jgi:hypothetical protein
MDENYDHLIEILEESVNKNGEKPLTNKWLLNILKMISSKIEKDDIYPFDPNWD